MKLWHNTEDTPRLPEKVHQRQVVELWIGTYPIEPGQQVKVEWNVKHTDGYQERGNLPALWRYNEFALGYSYWLATIGPFQKDDNVEYSIIGISGSCTLPREKFAFPVE